MNRLATLKPQKLIRALKKLGFQKIRQEGSHIFFKHPDGRTTVVPFHTGRDIGREDYYAPFLMTLKYYQRIFKNIYENHHRTT